MEFDLMHLLQQYGYIGIFLFLMLGIVGLPLPDEIMMTFLGYLTTTGQLNLFWTFISAFLGSVCGITLSYLLGLKLGLPFLKRYGSRFFITPKRLQTSQRLFRKYGPALLFVSYFIPGVRHVTAYLSGISHIPYLRFALYAYLGAVFWCATFIGLGHVLGANWELLFVMLHKYGFLVLLLAIPLVLGWILYKRKRRQTT
jgi:membrane protein DedA with SNARE-associated domain